MEVCHDGIESSVFLMGRHGGIGKVAQSTGSSPSSLHSSSPGTPASTPTFPAVSAAVSAAILESRLGGPVAGQGSCKCDAMT